MSLVAHPTVPRERTAAAQRPAFRDKRAATMVQCLVLSADPSRREMLTRAASDAGWDAVACGDTSQGWSYVQRQRFEMLLVDLELSDSAAADFRELTEHASANQQPLLMVCGEEANALQEIWARQLGAWLYLPGVSQEGDVRDLCEQAIPVVEKLVGERELAST